MSRAFCVIVLLTAVATSGGCQWAEAVAKPVGNVLKAPYDLTLGQVFASDEPEERSGAVIDAVDAYRIGYDVPRWTSDLGLRDSDELAEVAVLGDLIVCVARPSNTVTGVSVRDGAVVWRRVVARSTDQLFEPVRLDDEILVNTETSLMHLAASDGRLLGRSTLEAAVSDRPVLVGTHAIFGGLSGRVFAHNTVTGYSTWSQQMTAGITVRPVAAGSNVFVADSRGVYAMFAIGSGRALWKGETYGRISAVPVVDSEGVFVAGEDQTLYALERAAGKEKWKYMAAKPLKSSPTVLGGDLFLHDPDRGLLAVDAATGEELWSKDTSATPVSVSGGRLLLQGPDGLTTIDPGSGKSLTTVPVEPLKSILLGPDDSLILIGDRGRFVRLDPLR